MTFWDDERDAELRQYRLDGVSFSIIAAKLGCTRNAAIGRAHRIGIEGKAKPAVSPRVSRNPKPKPPRHVPPARKPPVIRREPLRMVVNPSQPLPESLLLPLWKVREGQCRYPYGEPSDIEAFRFCAAPCEGERPYCAAHWKLTHTAYERPATRTASKSVMPAKIALAVSCD